MSDAKAGWEVEGFIDRLTKRDDSNDERLVLEAIRHLRGFARDCDALRESNREYVSTIERLTAENERLRGAAETSRQAIAYSMDMGTTDPAGVLLQALNKCDAALPQHQHGAEGGK